MNLDPCLADAAFSSTVSDTLCTLHPIKTTRSFNWVCYFNSLRGIYPSPWESIGSYLVGRTRFEYQPGSKSESASMAWTLPRSRLQRGKHSFSFSWRSWHTTFRNSIATQMILMSIYVNVLHLLRPFAPAPDSNEAAANLFRSRWKNSRWFWFELCGWR